MYLIEQCFLAFLKTLSMKIFMIQREKRAKKNQRCDVDQSVSICTLSIVMMKIHQHGLLIFIFSLIPLVLFYMLIDSGYSCST